MDLAAAAGARLALLTRVDYGPAMQLADEGRSDAVRRDRRLRNRRERADASVREHGTRSAVQVNSTWHALGIYYSDQPLILFRRVRTFHGFGDELLIRIGWHSFVDRYFWRRSLRV